MCSPHVLIPPRNSYKAARNVPQNPKFASRAIGHTQPPGLHPQQHLKLIELALAHRHDRHNQPPRQNRREGCHLYLAQGDTSILCLYQPALTLTCHCEPHVRRGNPGAASKVLLGVWCAKPQRLSAVATCPPVKVNAWWYYTA